MDRTAPFPVTPTTIPQARKYTREFKASAGRVFTEDDTIIIEIPPIQNTYLTKDARIYFNFDLAFEDHSFDTGVTPSTDWWATTTPNLVNMLRKPVPMLDVAGPYTLFRDVEVYDYLGNTLLEKINRHDILACTLSDFYLDSEIDRLRPPVAEAQASQIIDMFSVPGQVRVPLTELYSLPSVTTKVNGINLLDPSLNDLLVTSGPTRVIDYYTYVNQPPTQTPTLVQVPTWQFSISLLSFLGSGSKHFVPLHNGYRIVLKTNTAATAVKFSLPSGGLKMATTNAADPVYVTIVPKIKEYNIYDVKFRADLLEVSPDFDERIDKTVHCMMNSYLSLGKCEKPTIIPGNFLSVNNIKVSMRQLPPVGESYSELGFRSRTYVKSARLLCNDAVQQEYTSVSQMRVALGPDFDASINAQAFSTDQPRLEVHGSAGYMYPYPSQQLRGAIAALTGTSLTNYGWIRQKNDNYFYTRFNDQAGKFLLLFDLSLNQYSDNTITGIDSTKVTLKLDLKRSFLPADPFETDVFINHDAIITIKPGQSSSVSF